MKIAVISDAHANLPALEAALQAIRAQDCDAIFHVGDAISIGPYPAECVDLMQDTPTLQCVKGNHDLYFVNGLPNPQPAWMSDGEVRHQLWTHEQLGEGRRAIVSQWPMTLEYVMEGLKVAFLHYGLTPSGNDFASLVHDPDSRDLDVMFRDQEAQMIFFGHDHAPSDIQGRSRYINPGSLGCSPTATARYVIASIQEGLVEIAHHSEPYHDRDLLIAFEDRNVPERDFIYKAFFGGRFGA